MKKLSQRPTEASTLRGHVMAEVMALDAVRRERVGCGYDGVLLVPAFLEAGG